MVQVYGLIQVGTVRYRLVEVGTCGTVWYRMVQLYETSFGVVGKVWYMLLWFGTRCNGLDRGWYGIVQVNTVWYM